MTEGNYPREPQEFIDRLVEDIRAHVDEPSVLLNIGSGDGYEADQIQEAIGVSTKKVEGLDGVVISSRTGPCEFYVYVEDGLHSIFKRKDRDPLRVIYKIAVSLDDYCWVEGIEPDILMIDAEGATYEILLGGEETLRRVKLIQAETERHEVFIGQHLDADVDALLADMGFKRVRKDEAGKIQYASVWVKA